MSEGLWDLARRAIEACHPRQVLKGRLAPVPTFLVALGKCAESMARVAIEDLGPEFRGGILISKYPTELEGMECLQGGHPVPNADSFAAGQALLAALARRPPGEPITLLLSGGSSSLVEVPRAGVLAQEIVDLNRELMGSGQPIEEMNRRRAQLSALKGGGLLAYLRGPLRTLVLADAPAQWVGSGPTQGTPLEVIAEASTMLEALPEAVRLEPLVGEARLRGEQLAQLDRPGLYACVGECGVTVRGTGRGGRCQELALSFALASRGKSPRRLLAVASDGEDGQDVAGAWADSVTAERVPGGQEDLNNNDSFAFFVRAGQHLQSGPTGTNVNDLVLLQVD